MRTVAAVLLLAGCLGGCYTVLRHPAPAPPPADRAALMEPSEAPARISRENRCAECHTRGFPSERDPAVAASHETIARAPELWDDGYDDLDLYVYDPFFVRQPFYYSYGFGSGLNRFYATPWWLSVPTRGPEQSGANSGDVQSSPSQAVTAPAPADAESSEPDAAPQRRANPRKRFGLATTQKVQPVPDKVVRSGSASGAQHSGAGSGSVKQRKGGAPSSSAQPKPASKKRRPTARKRLR